jgi:hypothetical protein
MIADRQQGAEATRNRVILVKFYLLFLRFMDIIELIFWKGDYCNEENNLYFHRIGFNL